ncbi:hypothetical protein AMAG_06053 [Allomyces macrogynus ATCC 38327]|uniref:Cyclin-D1-binding protein 1-like N-terminal domain-containing protein n=1 Tax=Allomyces macrogynus (strain ATCC 38327) TaxID=578462 RepID=A0A0L0SE74_ALLM3|nr:hypothetical protein AMAG_06053 [Allomyces macrogynus ATCC 38327]|eukprot:KNE60690.1 hypothetical protein AMAG_06053 [Allomyces macrogynus ATCC 38327]
MAGKKSPSKKSAKRTSIAASTTGSTTPAACAEPLTQLHQALQVNLDLIQAQRADPTLVLHDFDDDFYSQQLTAVGKHIHHAITKFVLVHKEGPAAVTHSASLTECRSLVTLATQLAAHVSTLPPARGTTLRNLHLTTATEILLALRAMVANALTAVGAPVPSSSGDAADAPSTTVPDAEMALAQYLFDTGVAWKCAETLEKLPRTNAAAVRGKWVEFVGLAKDVVAEVKESIEEYEEGCDDDDDDNEFSDSDDSDDGDNVPPPTPVDADHRAAELARMRAILKLLQVSTVLATRMSALLTTANRVDGLDVLSLQCAAMQIDMDDLGAACAEPPLPPAQDIAKHADRLFSEWRKIVGVHDATSSRGRMRPMRSHGPSRRWCCSARRMRGWRRSSRWPPPCRDW